VGSALAATALGVSLAVAQEGPPVPVSFEDSAAPLEGDPAINLEIHDNAARFAPVNPYQSADAERPRRLELELAAGGGDSPIDISVAQRASLGANADGEIDREGRGSELRVGQGLVDRREGNSSQPSLYMFVASDDEALTWQPGSRSEFGGRGSSLALQDRVEVGDMSAGVTYERNGIQASLAYVEREESTRVGNQNFTQEEAFTGVTVTMRR
jgi:hypothetical protein